MNESYINRIIDEIGEDLFPDLGKISDIEISRFEKFIFSKIYYVKIFYNELTKKVVLKKYIKEKRLFNAQLSVESEYNILNYIYNQFSLLKGINVVRPITFIADEDIVVTEDFGGDKLDALIVDRIRWIPSGQDKKKMQNCLFQCGRWLRYFHKFTKQDELIPFRQDLFVENIDKKLSSCTKYGINKKICKKLYLFVNDKFKKIGNQQLDMVGYHSDFTPWNILANDDEIRVLDFDRFSYRDRYDDLTLFLAALEGTKSIVGMIGKNIDRLKGAFLHGYDTKDMDPDILQLYVLKNTLKALSWIDIWHSANIRFFDVQYEKYRKKKQIGNYLKVINSLITNRNDLCRENFGI